MSVEVERKFVCDADTQRKLEGIGAVCVGERQFLDQYFDTPDFQLTLSDMWLRKRKECWELKCSTTTEETSGEPRKGEALCTRYKEITNLPEIQQRVKAVIKNNCDEGKSSSQEDECWLSRLNLMCFAAFTTQRCSFTLEEEGVQVDLDQADFGYHVGEIEVLVPEGEEVQSALERIERTARKLGLNGDQRVQGKMDIYLQRYRPEHYAKLLSAHVL